MRRITFLGLLAIIVALPYSQAAPAPQRANAKPAVIHAGTEKNVADVLQSLAADRGAQLRAVCHNKKVAELEIVRRQKDARAWLGKNLRVERVEGRNLIRVSMRAGTATEQAMIINAVVDTYLEQFDGMRASVMETNKSVREQLNADAGAGKLTQVILAKAEKSIQKREEFIRSLPALVEHAKIR